MILQILLAEDDLDLADTIIQFMEISDINCDHADNGVSAVNLTETNNYDVIILDVRMPRMNGFTACEKIRESGSDVPILMLTARDTLEDKDLGFHSGADDYLVKPFELKELVMRIRALSKRRSKQSKILRFGNLEINCELKAVRLGDKFLTVTPTGWIILEALAIKYPSVVSKDELERFIWGDEPPDSNSFKVHLYKLRKEIASVSEHNFIETVSGHGFVLNIPK